MALEVVDREQDVPAAEEAAADVRSQRRGAGRGAGARGGPVGRVEGELPEDDGLGRQEEEAGGHEDERGGGAAAEAQVVLGERTMGNRGLQSGGSSVVRGKQRAICARRGRRRRSKRRGPATAVRSMHRTHGARRVWTPGRKRTGSFVLTRLCRRLAITATPAARPPRMTVFDQPGGRDLEIGESSLREASTRVWETDKS